MLCFCWKCLVTVVPNTGTVYIVPKIGSMKYEKFRKSIHSAEHVVLREYLVDKRKKLGLTQRDLGARLSVHHTLIGKVETGDRRLDVVELIDYCKALEVDPHEVVSMIMESQN